MRGTLFRFFSLASNAWEIVDELCEPFFSTKHLRRPNSTDSRKLFANN